MIQPDLLPSKLAAVVSDISYRQLDYWARSGFVNPHAPVSGSGNRRAYDVDGCFKLAVAKEVLIAGNGSEHALVDLLEGVVVNLDGMSVFAVSPFSTVSIDTERLHEQVVERFAVTHKAYVDGELDGFADVRPEGLSCGEFDDPD